MEAAAADDPAATAASVEDLDSDSARISLLYGVNRVTEYGAMTLDT